MSGAKVADGAAIQLPKEATLDPDGAGADLSSRNTTTATDFEAIHQAFGAGPSDAVFTTTTAPLNEEVQLVYGGPGMPDREAEKPLNELTAKELAEVLPTLEAAVVSNAFTADQIKTITVETLRQLDSDQLKALVISHLTPFKERGDFKDKISPLLQDVYRSADKKNQAIASLDPAALNLAERGYAFFDGLEANFLKGLSVARQAAILNGMNAETLAAFSRNKGQLLTEISVEALPKLGRAALAVVAPNLSAQQLELMSEEVFATLLPSLSPAQISAADSTLFDELKLGTVKALLSRPDIEGKLTAEQLEAMTDTVFGSGDADLIGRYAKLVEAAPKTAPAEPVRPEPDRGRPAGGRPDMRPEPGPDATREELMDRFARGSIPHYYRITKVADNQGDARNLSITNERVPIYRVEGGRRIDLGVAERPYITKGFARGFDAFAENWLDYQDAIMCIGDILASRLPEDQLRNPPRFDQLPADLQRDLQKYVDILVRVGPQIEGTFGGLVSERGQPVGGDRRIGGVSYFVNTANPKSIGRNFQVYQLGAALRFVSPADQKKVDAALAKKK